MAEIGDGRAQVRPMLGTREDMEALWENLDIIDCFATDHGQQPHRTAEPSLSSNLLVEATIRLIIFSLFHSGTVALVC